MVKSPLFDLLTPTVKLKGLVAIPHSGEWIPEELAPFLIEDRRIMLEDVDFKVFDLIDAKHLLSEGIAIMVAHVHRVAVDLNRAASKSVLFWETNTHGIPMRRSLPSDKELQLFQERYHAPYYAVLKDLIEVLERDYPSKRVPFIDLHSMPSKAQAYHLKLNPHQETYRADFCLSDLKGESCVKEYIETAFHKLEQKGYRPAINNPYFGGYGTQFAHQYRTNAIQIEINRALYMDEEKKELTCDKATKLKHDLTETLSELFRLF